MAAMSNAPANPTAGRQGDAVMPQKSKYKQRLEAELAATVEASLDQIRVRLREIVDKYKKAIAP